MHSDPARDCGARSAHTQIGTPVIFDILEEFTKIALLIAGLYFAIGAYVAAKRAKFKVVDRRRLAILVAVVLAVSAIKVSEDAIGGESGPVDQTTLLFIHGHTPGALTGLFATATLTGSSHFMVPLASVTTILLLIAGRRREALLVAASVIGGAIVVYVVKMIVGRVRPALWETDEYWGSSFPSGHTLVVAAFATATLICISRIWPAAHRVALWIALLWIVLVALSRMVLGVHWPTDVLAAALVGAFLPLAISVVLEFRNS